MSDSNIFAQAFEVFQDRELYLEKIGKNAYPSSIIGGQVTLIVLFTCCYGVIMGSYNGVYQALLSGIKIWGLFMLTVIICFPSFYIVQIVLGSKIRMKQLLIMLLSGMVMVSTLIIAFAPIVLLFQLSGSSYNFIQLLHVAIFAFSGVFGMRVVLESLTHACENQQVYPKIGLTVFKVWVIIFAFVGLQLSWNLRPFIGTKEMPFQLFRTESQGNVYATIFKSLGSLFVGEAESEEDPLPLNQTPKEEVPPQKEETPPTASPPEIDEEPSSPTDSSQ